MTTATITFNQMEATNEETARSIPSASSQISSRGSIFGRWGRRASVTSMTSPSGLPVPVHPGAPSMIIKTLPVQCEQCEDLKTQSDINRKMLNDCLTDLKIKETEADAVKDLVKSLQTKLDQAQLDLEMEQARFKRELASKDEQLSEQIARSKLHLDASNELAAQLTKQQKEVAEGLASPVANHERELQAKDAEIAGLQDQLEKQEFVEGAMKAELNGKIMDLEGDLRDMKQELEGKASAHAAELQRQFEQRFNDDLQKCQMRMTDLEAENQKLYAQFQIEDDLRGDDLSDAEQHKDGIAL